MALKGLKVTEMLGLAPGPMCGKILADFGAIVTVVQKIEPSSLDVLDNDKRVISLDLKTKEGVSIMKKLCASTDILLDTYRPGVMEKLDLGPETLMKYNSGLIYARLTGYGQNGLYKDKAGHDINYVAMSGILSMLTKGHQPPQPPLNLLGDFAGGSLMCVIGILLALFERFKSGKGQVIDCSMTEAIAYLSSWIYKSQNLPIWSGQPGSNILDGGFPFYNTYRTKDGKFMAVGAIEPQFYSNLLKGLELSENEFSQLNKENKEVFEKVFLTKTQDEWCTVFDNLDACVTPVLDLKDIDKHKYHAEKKSFYRYDETLMPYPTPKLSGTPSSHISKMPSPAHGQHTIQVLKELGYSNKDIKYFLSQGCVYASSSSKL